MKEKIKVGLVLALICLLAFLLKKAGIQSSRYRDYEYQRMEETWLDDIQQRDQGVR